MIIIYLLFKITTIPTILISNFSTIIIKTFNHHFKITNNFKTTFNNFNNSIIHQSHISSNIKNLLKQNNIINITQILITIFYKYTFTNIIKKTKYLKILLTTISKNIHSIKNLIYITIIYYITLIFTTNITSIIIIIINILIKNLFKKYQISHSILSKTLKNSNTIILPLIP